MKSLGFLLAAALCFSGLAFAQKVTYNYDRSADFSRYRTYTWVRMPDSSNTDPLLDQQIRQAVEADLAQKGIVRSDSNPGLLLAYQTIVRPQQQVETWGDTYPWGWGPGVVQTTVTTVDVGSLVLDMYDAAQHRLVWRGAATKTLHPSSDPDKNLKNLQKSVEKLLKDFPPKRENK